jgi:uncharacterized protein (TIRG00374 family)
VKTGYHMKSRYTVLIGILISVLILVVLLAGKDLTQVRVAFAAAQYGYVIPSAALLGLSMFTRALRWRGLLSDRLPLRHAFPILNISYLFNGALPFRLGEVARIFLANRTEQRVPAFTVLSTIVVERLLDLLAVLGLLGVALALLDVPDYVASAGIALGVAAIASLTGLIVVARFPFPVYRALGRIEQRIPLAERWHLGALAARFVDGLTPLTLWRSAARAVAWSLISWALSVIAGYVLMFAFFPQADWLTTMLFIALASLAVSIPAAPGAVGPYEAGVVLALTWTGYDQPEGIAVAFAVALHVMTTGVYVLLGTAGLLQLGLTLGQVMQGARRVDTSADPAARPARLE